MRIFLVLLVLLLEASFAMASPFAHDEALMQVAASEFVPKPGPQNILPKQQPPAISNQQATAKVRQAYGTHKILTVRLIESKGPPVYRVKTLSEEGVVQYVFVDGTTGTVFE